MPTRITDHATRALERLLLQYRDSPNIQALVQLQASAIQQLEDAAMDFFSKVALPTATGIVLDRLGAIVGQQREGRDDATYRTWIEARIKLNTGSGTFPEIVALFEPLVPLGTALIAQEAFPAAFTFTISNVVITATLASQLVQILRLARAGGVRAILYWQESASGALFRFDSGPGFDTGVFSGAAE
jgi:hypothetical protein